MNALTRGLASGLTAGVVALAGAGSALASPSPSPAASALVTCANNTHAIGWPASTASHNIWASTSSPYMLQFSDSKGPTLFCPETKSDGNFMLEQYGTSRCIEHVTSGVGDTWNEGSCGTSNLSSDLYITAHTGYDVIEALDGWDFCLYWNGDDQNAYARKCGTGTVANEEVTYYLYIP